MSLEHAIQQNTEALQALRAVLAHWTPVTGVEKAAAPALPTPSAGEGPALIQEAAAALTFDQVKGPFVKLATQSSEKAKAVLAKHGIAKLSEAKPEQYAAILASIQGAA